MLHDALQVQGRALGRAVRTLAGDRVVGHHHVADAQHGRAGGQFADRVADGGREPPGERAARVRQLDGARPVVLPRREAPHQVQGEPQVLRRVLDALEDVQRAAGDALPEQDVARAGGGQRRNDEQLADARHQVAAHRRRVRVLGPRAEAVHVGDGQRALRRVVGRTRHVPAEHGDDLALARRDQHQVVGAREVVQVGDGRRVHDHLPAALGEGLQPAGHLHPLVDRLRGAVQPPEPVDGPAAVGGGDRDADALDARAPAAPRS